MLLVKPNNKYSHCYFLRDVPGLMLLIIFNYLCFTQWNKNLIILISHRLAYLFVSKLHKAKKTIWGLGEDGES